MFNRCFLPGLICLLIFSGCGKKTPEKTQSVPVAHTDTFDTDTLPRTSITFILGKDENTGNPYYSLANDYYRMSDADKTEIVIDSMVSLLEVRNYLDDHRPANGRPWGLINLVTHGNEFVDLSVWVTPTGARVSEESLQKAMADSVLRPLDSLAIDKKTVFHLHGCAVGNNTGLLNFLGIAFGGKENPARVKASKMFEYYTYLTKNKDPRMVQHYYARVWYTFYHVDSMPERTDLAEQLKTKYPDDSIEWLEAVYRQHPDNPSEAYHLNLKIPVVWEDFYESKAQLPDLRTRAKQSKWLENKTEFLTLIQKTRIPREYFRIKYYTLIYNQDNDTIYSNKVKGMAGVICVVKPQLRKSGSTDAKYLPFIPAENDRTFFGFSDSPAFIPTMTAARP